MPSGQPVHQSSGRQAQPHSWEKLPAQYMIHAIVLSGVFNSHYIVGFFHHTKYRLISAVAFANAAFFCIGNIVAGFAKPICCRMRLRASVSAAVLCSDSFTRCKTNRKAVFSNTRQFGYFVYGIFNKFRWEFHASHKFKVCGHQSRLHKLPRTWALVLLQFRCVLRTYLYSV